MPNELITTPNTTAFSQTKAKVSSAKNTAIGKEQDPSSPATAFIEQGISLFKSMFDGLSAAPTGGQAEQKINLSPKTTKQAGNTGEVSRNVFSLPQSAQATPGQFSPEDMALLQQSLAKALTASLFSRGTSQPQAPQSQPPQAPQPAAKTESPSLPTAKNTLLQSFTEIAVGKDGLGLDDAFDAFNALNHIPVVSNLYQQYSGDEVNALSSLAGSYLLTGPAGLAYAAADIASKEMTGDSLLTNLQDIGMSMFNQVKEPSTDTAPHNSGQTSSAPQSD